MTELAPPLSFLLTPRQVAWLDGRRHHGSLSRSAALRIALDELMLLEEDRATAPAPPEAPSRSGKAAGKRASRRG